MAHAYAAQDVETDSDPWSFELRNGIICKAEVIPPDWKKDFGWSLANFYSQADADANPELATRLGAVLAERGIKRVYAPTVVFRPDPSLAPVQSTNIVRREDLTDRIVLPGGAQMFRNRRIPGGGVPIRTKEAFMMSGAGCPPLILAGKGFCVPMHGSRDTMLDRDYLNGKPPREHPSIIHAAADFLEKEYGVKRRKMYFKGGLHIPPWEFLHLRDHPEFGPENQVLYDHLFDYYGPNILRDDGQFDLAELALTICSHLSIEDATFGNPLPKRASTTRDEQKGELRNLVLAYRTQ